MSNMDEIPKFLDKRIFQLIFNLGEVSKLNREERMSYEESLKAKWDTQNAFDYVMKEGREQGIKEGRKEERTKAEQERLESAKSLKQSGIAIQLIAESLKLPLEVVEKL